MHVPVLLRSSLALAQALACARAAPDPGTSIISAAARSGYCTEVGCDSFLRVELVFATGLTPGDVRVVVEHGGESFRCEFGAEDDPCHEDIFLVTANEVGRAVILLSATPRALRVTVVAATGSETQIIEPAYERSQPNGPDCPPTCSSAKVTARFAL